MEQKLLADWLKRDRRASESSGQRSPLTDQRPGHQNRQTPRCGTAGNRKVPIDCGAQGACVVIVSCVCM